MILHEITYKGKIEFEIPCVTKKHENQSLWKRHVMCLFDGDLCKYYQFFIRKRYNLQLNTPLRSSHCSIINDRFSDVKGETMEDKELLWNEVKDKYNGKEIEITFDVNIRLNKQYWYMDVVNKSCMDLMKIRQELGLGQPYYPFHMTIGFAHSELRMQHHQYIHDLIKKGLIC